MLQASSGDGAWYRGKGRAVGMLIGFMTTCPPRRDLRGAEIAPD